MYIDYQYNTYHIRDVNTPRTSVKDLEAKIAPELFAEVLAQTEFKAERNFFLDLEEDPRVWYEVSLLGRLRCETQLDVIRLYNKSKAAKRERYADRMTANPDLWNRLMPMIQRPLCQIVDGKTWLATCLQEGAGVEDLVALLQLYNELAHLAGDYPNSPDVTDQLAPWTTSGRFFDLERDLKIVEDGFKQLPNKKQKRLYLDSMGEKYTHRAGYPAYFLKPMEELIHNLYRSLEPKK